MATVDVAKLERSLMWAIKNDLPNQELIHMLRPIVRLTNVTEVRGRLARVELSERLLLVSRPETNAWEAARMAREVLDDEKEPLTRARAFGVSALALSLMGHFKAARRAYAKALSEDPTDPVLAHNLGHLLSSEFGQHHAGCRWLARAYRSIPDDPEVAASYALALTKSGHATRATQVLTKALAAARGKNPVQRAEQLVQGWLHDQG